MRDVKMKEHIAAAIEAMGMTKTEELIMEASKAAMTKRRKGTVNSAGLALPEEVVEWLDGLKAEVTVDEDGTITVEKDGTMSVTLRSTSRQGVIQNGRVRERLVLAGYRLKDRVLFHHDRQYDVYTGVKSDTK